MATYQIKCFLFKYYHRALATDITKTLVYTAHSILSFM